MNSADTHHKRSVLALSRNFKVCEQTGGLYWPGMQSVGNAVVGMLGAESAWPGSMANPAKAVIAHPRCQKRFLDACFVPMEGIQLPLAMHSLLRWEVQANLWQSYNNIFLRPNCYLERTLRLWLRFPWLHAPDFMLCTKSHSNWPDHCGKICCSSNDQAIDCALTVIHRLVNFAVHDLHSCTVVQVSMHVRIY